MHTVWNYKKHYLLIILLISSILMPSFPLAVRAEEDQATAEADAQDQVAQDPVTKDQEKADLEPETGTETNDAASEGEATETPEQSDPTPVDKKTSDSKDDESVGIDTAQVDKQVDDTDTSQVSDQVSDNKAPQDSETDDDQETSLVNDKNAAPVDDSVDAKDHAKDYTKADDNKEKPEELAEQDPSQITTDSKGADGSTTPAKATDVLEAGEVLEVATLAKAPVALGNPMPGADEHVIRVLSFEELKDAIVKAGNQKTTIIIVESFELKETLTIAEGQDITLTAYNPKTEEDWKPIEQPADHAEEGEAKQREIIEEGRRRGEEALAKADLDKNPLPSEEQGDTILKRAADFVKDTLFKVFGKLTLGTKDTALYIDGNGEKAKTELSNCGSVIDIGKDGELVMENAVIMNSYNKHGYTGPIRVNSGGTFTMEGGRISSNTSYEDIDAVSSRPYAAGAVYVSPGGTFTLKNGLIDNNKGGMTGGVFAGDLWGSKGDPAVVNINGGIIAKNQSKTKYQMGGGLNGFPKSKITITDGIIAGNQSSDVGGGVVISSRYVSGYNNTYWDEKASVRIDYEKFIKENKAEANLAGGLIYKNRAGASGGGIYVDSNDVIFGKTVILDNHAGQFGGGIYVSFAPITQKLKDILITENYASDHQADAYLGGGNGGGLWNCPTGLVHIGDGHSVYVYNNASAGRGKDISFVKKAWNFELNERLVGTEFYSHISPVTKEGHLIKFVEDGEKKGEGVDIPEHLSYQTDATHLKAIYSEALIKEAWKNAQTFVLGNRGRNGGGLGSNANLITPEDKGDYAIEFNKKWDESVDKYKAPTTLRADLFIVPLDKDADYVKANYGTDMDLFKYGEILLQKEDNWHSRFDTNYFNGADKQEILDRLKIKNFSDIGLPDNAYNMDKGLPFTADELAKMGYKYLVVERGNDYFVEVTEEKPVDAKTVEAGTVEITRKYQKKFDKASQREDKDLFFYFYDPVKKVLTRLGQTKIHETKDQEGVGQGFGTTTFAHPLLLKKISEYKYYGYHRKFIEYEGWDDTEGYHNRDRGYAFVFTENKDGTLTLEVPYLWLLDYYDDVGFYASQSDKTDIYTINEKPHSFTLTNYNWGQLDVQKGWSNIKAQDQPESIDLYLLLDGKRILDGVDDQGKPIYRKLTLKADKGWKGSFDKLSPKALAAGKYSLEENSDIFVPEFINKKENFKIRIGYADNYHEEGQAANEVTSTGGHFKSYIYKNEDGSYRGVKLNLYLDGKKVDTKEFTFTADYEPEYDITFTYLNKNVQFDALGLETYGQSIPVKYYDVISNEPGLYEYNFYLQKDENGAYALYLPRLVINGVPYADLFIAEKLEPNPPYDDHEKTSLISPLPADEDWQIKAENHYGPTHEVEILKTWKADDNHIPDEITVVLTDADGHSQEIKISKDEDWKKVLAHLKGTLRGKAYSVEEADIPGFTGEIEIAKAGLKMTGKGQDGTDITLDYMTDELKRVLESGDYRYEVFALSDEDKDLEFNLDNIDHFIKIEKQNDGRYIIRYAKDLSLSEVFAINIQNTYKPPIEIVVIPPKPKEEPPVETVIPPKPPVRPGKSPETGLPTSEGLILLMAVGFLGLWATRPRKKNGQEDQADK